MEMTAHHRLVIDDDSHVGEARRLAAQLGRRLGLSAEDTGRLSICVNELGTNLRKHAGTGELLLRPLSHGGREGVELLALDTGPGMDLASSLRDGHSTAGTRGEGLGAVRRQSDEFDAWSERGKGSVVLCRIWGGGRPQSPVQIGGISLPLAAEAECGDAWACSVAGARVRVLVADGLGHGPIAARAADEAVRAFRAHPAEASPEAIVRLLHAALRHTRGAAVAVAELDLVARELRYCGLGNISGVLEAPGERPKGLVSHNGIAGHEARRIQEFAVAWPSGGRLVLHSDGISAALKVEASAALQFRHAALLAALLQRDHRRRGDDATAVVVKEP